MAALLAPLAFAALTATTGQFLPSENVTRPGLQARVGQTVFAPARVPDDWVRVLVFNETSRATALGANTEANSRAVIDTVNKLYLSGSLPLNLEMVIVGQVTFSSGMPFTWSTTRPRSTWSRGWSRSSARDSWGAGSGARRR